MTRQQPTLIQSRDNPLLKDLRRLALDSTAYRKQGRVWLEGDHLCGAALVRGQRPAIAVFSESFWPLAPAEYAQAAIKTIVMPDALWRDISGLESPARMGFVLPLPVEQGLDAPGNVIGEVWVGKMQGFDTGSPAGTGSDMYVEMAGVGFDERLQTGAAGSGFGGENSDMAGA